MAVSGASGSKQAYDYFWKDAATSTVGMGFRAVNTTSNVKMNTNALGGQLSVTPTSAKVSVEVARIEVKTDKPLGIFTGSFKAEALTASAGFGLQGDVAGTKANVNSTNGTAKTSSSGITVFSAGAEANIAKTTVTGGIKLGSVNIQLSGSAGYGAAANLTVGGGKGGLTGGLTVGVGATLGGSFKITWDSGKVDDTIAKATLSVHQPAPTIKTTPALPKGSTRAVATAD